MIVNRRITITSGTPIPIETVPTVVRSMSVQMRTGGTGRGLLLNLAFFPLGTVPDGTNGQHLAAELAPAAAAAPGGQWSYPDSDRGYDVSRIYIDGSNSGDTVTISYDKKV